MNRRRKLESDEELLTIREKPTEEEITIDKTIDRHTRLKQEAI
jgi:hypothetical protein